MTSQRSTSHRASTDAGREPARIVCVGEMMAMLSATPHSGGLRSSSIADISVGGAEANVATTLVHLGHRAEWFSRVGDDPFGERILDVLAALGVETPHVTVDPDRRTGIYFKEWSTGTTRVYYYRENSAATHLGEGDLPALALASRALCHVSGITPALSATCNDLVERVLAGDRPDGLTVSFDVNYRPGLWPVSRAAPRLMALARAADIVIVGRDEAEALWRTPTPDDVRDLLADVPVLVVKDDAHGATSYSREGSTFVSALNADVVEVVGAGDAFAAGYLAATVEGQDQKAALRLGHAAAAHTLLHSGDVGHLPPSDELRALAASDEDTWRSTHLRAKSRG